MRVAELADLAHVTVRTIRYYHQIGALPEPPRRSNGYRDYTVDHLVALLRIRQLTGSGLSLSQAGAVVAESPAASADEALDEVDRALEAQIAELTEQRERLARARAGDHVGLSRLAAALTVHPDDIPVATLFSHMFGEGPEAERLVSTLLTPEVRNTLVSTRDRFEAIDESTSGGELDALANELRWLTAEIARHLPPMPEDETYELITALAEREMNDRQREFLRCLA